MIRDVHPGSGTWFFTRPGSNGQKGTIPDPEYCIKHDSPVHEDQRNVGIEGLVEILDLLNRKIQKGEVVPHRDH
jgi:hypothetical protein